MSSPETSFGAAWADPARAAAVLRATAARSGIELAPLRTVDAVAAVVAAHAWGCASGQDSLTSSYTQPSAVTAAAAAVLLRAAGTAEPVHVWRLVHQVSEDEPLTCSSPLLLQLRPALVWAQAQLSDPEELAEALATAASDLLTAGGHRVAGAGWALLGEAECVALGTP